MISLLTLIASIYLPPHVDNDVWCLAENVYHESRGESLEGQLAVNAVVLNRANLTGMDLCEVVYEPYQFSWTLDNSTIDINSTEWTTALKIAYYSINSHSEFDYSHGATHYYNPNKVDPEWAKEMTTTKEIDNHKFLRL